jgi:primosomal protein N' (replication factor Y)
MQNKAQKTIIRVAVPVPLRQCFDYLLPDSTGRDMLSPGMRLLVPFGRNKLVGIIDEIADDASIAHARLKQAERVLDTKPIFNNELIWLCRWASQYYHHPLGEVYASALPARLRQDRPAVAIKSIIWTLTEAGRQAGPLPARAVRQSALMEKLRQAETGLAEAQLAGFADNWKATMRSLEDKGWVERREADVSAAVGACLQEQAHELNQAQRQAVDAIHAGLGHFAVYLLYGVTGSGKTEVYLQSITTVLQQDRQVLILVPEIGLTPQLMQRFSRRFDVPMAVFHSGLNDGERAYNWLQAQSGHARIIIGTRSAVFAALAKPGLIIVDEEHDLSFKQQDGFRYSARDLAIVRARHNDIPIILGSATPSLESIMNAEQQRYELLELPERAAEASHPTMHLIDLRHQRLDEGLSAVLLQKIHQHVDQGGQALLFLNRRGYAPTLLCHDCGWVSHCQRCDAHMTLHQSSGRMRCHHCGSERAPDSHCPACGSADLRPIGQGTERTEEALRRHFPDARITRIDRDTTRRKGSMEKKLRDAESGRDQILLGTQLLAKGHHFPNLSLVAILDSDQGLFSADFRSAERMAQLIMQVSGRAGRADRPGEVLIQTHHPDHELLQYTLRQDYHALSRFLLHEREMALWPPYSYLALLRAEATQKSRPMQFLRDAAACVNASHSENKVMLLGPVVAPMEKRAGRYRAQLLLQSVERADLHNLLSTWLPQVEQLKSSRLVRWSVDIDPQDMF